VIYEAYHNSQLNNKVDVMARPGYKSRQLEYPFQSSDEATDIQLEHKFKFTPYEREAFWQGVSYEALGPYACV
jgi:hypothetical protein